ncbi:MAG: hypothetical protein KC910_15175 [Candidatus Eremiobacteraeota bacterium]|nr:hypothetical protein [Candidatus Eremiobacteraeota bacterium]
MNRPIRALIWLCLFTLAASAVQADSVWQVVKGVRFQASMPGQPVLSQHKTDTPAGSVIEKRYQVDNKRGSFTLSTTELPGTAILFAGGSGAILDQATEAFLRESGAVQTSRKDVDYQGHQARRLAYSKKSRQGRALLVMVEHQLVVLDAMASPSDISHFLDSLKL